jgi:hypothetical protein
MLLALITLFNSRSSGKLRKPSACESLSREARSTN